MLNYKPYGTYKNEELFLLYSDSGESMIVPENELLEFIERCKNA
jgi:hypothetical protein